MDRLHLELHREQRAAGLIGSSCVLALELDGRVDAPALDARLSDAARGLPELSFRLGNGPLSPLRWRSGRPAPSLVTLPLAGDPFETALARMLDGSDGAAPWRIELHRAADRDVVMLHWFHPFIDALGACRLLAWLGGQAAPPPIEARWRSPEARLAGRSARERVRLARAFAQNAARHGGGALANLGKLNGSAPGRQRAMRIQFDDAETAAFDRAVARRARRADASVVLWACARLLDRLFAERDQQPERYLVPVPLSLDPKGGCQRMFGNNVSMMVLSLGRAELGDEALALAELAAQKREIVRTEADLGMVAALDLMRLVPERLVGWLSRRPFGGQRASFLLSSPGDLGLGRFAGCDVRDAFALPAIPPDPGFMAVAQRHRGRLSVVLSHCDGYVSSAALQAQRAAFIADLLH